MSSENKEEIELMVDAIGMLASDLEDFQIEEEDLVNLADNPVDVAINRFNIGKLKVAIAGLNQAKISLQQLTEKNA